MGESKMQNYMHNVMILGHEFKFSIISSAKKESRRTQHYWLFCKCAIKLYRGKIVTLYNEITAVISIIENWDFLKVCALNFLHSLFKYPLSTCIIILLFLKLGMEIRAIQICCCIWICQIIKIIGSKEDTRSFYHGWGYECFKIEKW